MNRTILILNLLASSITITRSIDVTTANIEDENYKLDDSTRRIGDETDDDVLTLARTDDIITTSELSKIYSSEENQFTKTRSLKDETENEQFTKAALKQESRVADLKSGEKLANKTQAKSDTNENQLEIETKVAKREESTTTERTSPVAKVEGKKAAKQEEKQGSNAEVVEESKSAKKEQSEVEEKSRSKAKIDDESKDAKKEENRAELDTSEIIEQEKTTESLRREIKAADYLENGEDDIKSKIASDEDSERMGYELPVNDESNSAWDILDDIPTSRRMLSLPANLNIEVKAKAGNENVDPVEARIAPEIKISPKNHIAYGPPKVPAATTPQFQSTVSLPLIYPAIFPGRRFIVPGYMKIPATPPNRRAFDIRRLQNQEPNNIISQNKHVPDLRFGSNNDMNQNNFISQNKYVPDFRGSNNGMNQNQNVVVEPHGRSEIQPENKYVPAFRGSNNNMNQNQNVVLEPHGRSEIQPENKHVPAFRESNNNMNQNQNVVVESHGRSEIQPEFRDVVEDINSKENEDINSKENSNAYPYTPPPEDLKIPKIPMTSIANTVFAKLAQASEHPEIFNPNINEKNVQNIQSDPYNNYVRPNNYYANSKVQNYPGTPYPNYVRPNNYAAVQNYGTYRYVTGFGRLR